MATVTGKYPDQSKYDKEGRFKIAPDKSFIHSTWAPPIQWTGWVNNEQISFIQISRSADGRDDFDFSGFPESCERAIDYIIEAIDKAMKVMD
jgi:hypothetical protein